MTDNSNKILASVGNIKNQVMDLEDLLNSLTEKLQPILEPPVPVEVSSTSPSPGMKQQVTSHPMLSPMEFQLTEITSIQACNLSGIQNLIDRIRL